jgi:very-short-patch-repair endonuclease
MAIDEWGRHEAAVLACGPGAVISHLSAAGFWGLREPLPVVIDVIVPDQSGRKVDGIRGHRCRYPEPIEITELESIPCTAPSRTIVDLAGTLGRASLRRVVAKAAVLRLLDLAALDAAIARARGRRGISHLRGIVAPWRTEDGPVPHLRSILEAWVLSAALEAGLPRPRCNVQLRLDGEQLEVDLLWEEQRVVIETDGEETHGTSVAFRHDRWRDQILAASGYRTARVTWDQMEDEPGAVIERIRRLLEASRGFR